MPQLRHLAVDSVRVTTSHADKKWGLIEVEHRAAADLSGEMLARLPHGEGRVLLTASKALTITLTMTDSEVGVD